MVICPKTEQFSHRFRVSLDYWILTVGNRGCLEVARRTSHCMNWKELNSLLAAASQTRRFLAAINSSQLKEAMPRVSRIAANQKR